MSSYSFDQLEALIQRRNRANNWGAVLVVGNAAVLTLMLLILRPDEMPVPNYVMSAALAVLGTGLITGSALLIWGSRDAKLPAHPQHPKLKIKTQNAATDCVFITSWRAPRITVVAYDAPERGVVNLIVYSGRKRINVEDHPDLESAIAGAAAAMGSH